MPINIVLIDDHIILGQGIAQLIGTQLKFKFLGFFLNTEEIKPFLKTSTVDVILLDISVPPTNGIDFCMWLKLNYPSIKIIFLSMHFDSVIINRAMKAGGNAYITKDVDIQILYEAILCVVQGKIYYSKNVENILFDNPFQYHSNKKLPTLSSIEKDVLNCIVEGRPSHEIAEKLLISINTVELHRSNLLVKFDSKNITELIRDAILYEIIQS